MSNNRIISRYALALLKDATNRSIETEIVKDAEKFVIFCKENRELVLFLQSPVIQTAKKQAILNKVFDTTFSADTNSFIRLVLEHKREMLLPEIFRRYIGLYKDQKSILPAEVVSTIPLSSEKLNEISQRLKKITGYREIELKNTINEKIMGGITLKFQDKMIDLSISKKISRLKDHLLN